MQDVGFEANEEFTVTLGIFYFYLYRCKVLSGKGLR